MDILRITLNSSTGTSIIYDNFGGATPDIDYNNSPISTSTINLPVDANGYVKNEGNVEAGVSSPFPVSYRSIVPKKSEVQNLFVPVCLSASHNCIRLYPDGACVHGSWSKFCHCSLYGHR